MKTSRIGIALAILAMSLPASLFAQTEEGTTPLFTVNIGTTGWTTAIFLVLLAILWKFAWGPILGAVEARESGIQGALDEAAENQAAAAALLEEHKAQMADARRQAQQIIAEAKDAGQNVRQEIEEKARSEGAAMLDRAKAEIEREKDAAIDSLRKESVEIALAAASKLLKEHLDSDKDRDLVMGFVDQLGRNPGAEA
jgi:F-type H+-transporting ATPase subunit b